MNIRQHVIVAGIGWIVGVAITIAMALVIFPTLVPGAPFSGSTPELLMIGLVGLPASLAALIGGLVGGRVASEGGRRGQILMAVIVGVMLALPVSCVGFWVVGW